MNRSIYSYNLNQSIVSALVRAGFSTDEDIQSSTEESIASETQLSVPEVQVVLTAINQKPEQRQLPVSCAEQLRRESLFTRIKTFSANMDQMLGGGFASTRVSEVCGLPGTGKTQLCLQLCVTVQIPPTIGGSDGEALYIDNEGSFTLERLTDMSEAAVMRCQETASTSANRDCLDEVQSFSVDKILRGVHYMHCIDHLELIAAVHMLPDFISSNLKIKLVIVDNIAVHFRHLENFNRRNNILHNFIQKLSKMAISFNLVVILTNPMTTRIRSDGCSFVMPALGDIWSHFACQRLILKSDEDQHRTATLEKSSYLPRSTVPFKITSAGIEDSETYPNNRPISAALNQQSSRNRLNASNVEPYYHSSGPAKRFKYN